MTYGVQLNSYNYKSYILDLTFDLGSLIDKGLESR